MRISIDGFIGTIDEDEDVPVEEESSESDEDAVHVEKKQKKRAKAREFNPEFMFEDNFADAGFVYDPMLYAKKKRVTSTTLDEKITKLRKEKKSNQKEVINEDDNIKESGEENSDESDLEDLHVTKLDTVKVKERYKKKRTAEQSEKIIFDENVDTFDDRITFADMNLSRPLMKALSSLNFSKPTPIQTACIPIALKGRDLCACAVTGSGKTAGFMLPILERLLYKPKSSAVSRVLILLPTRELAVQVHQVCKQLSQFTRVTSALAAGGLDMRIQEAALRLGPDIIVATPGRLIDHLHNTPSFELDSIEILVLDEADRMLDEYFKHHMTEVIRLCSRTRQTMLFSATMTEEVKDLAAVSLDKPVRVFVNNSNDLAMNLRQEFIRIRPNRESDREAIIAALVKRTFHERVMVFIQTKIQAHRMHIVLGLLGVNVGELHGNLSQTQRLEALRRFKDGEIDVLLTTDVAARGLDIADVRTVINFTMPSTLEHYVHRVGRTARAGNSGRSITLVGEKERRLLKDIVKRAMAAVKSRVVPNEVIENYKDRIRLLEDDVVLILEQEIEEKHIAKTENQLNKTERLLRDGGDSKMKRNWFQTHQERLEVKAAHALTPYDNQVIKPNRKNNKPRSKTQMKRALTAEDRANFEIMKSQAFAARVAKRGRKQERIRAFDDSEPSAKKPKSKGGKKTAFESELTNTERKSVKALRYKTHEARKEKKQAAKMKGQQRGPAKSRKPTRRR